MNTTIILNMELHLTVGWSIGEKESSLQKREMFQSGDRCTAAVCWPQCQYSSVRGVHVLGPGPGPAMCVTHLPWTGSAPAGGWGQLPQTSDHPHTAVADWCRPTLTLSSCSRSRSCHVRPNLTRVPSCFKNATFMRYDWAEFYEI